MITLNTPTSATTVSATFEGLAGATGYRSLQHRKAGWRYGFAAYLNNGNCIYGEIFSGQAELPLSIVPIIARNSILLLVERQQEHWHHPWDDNDANDEQWPYKVKFTG